MRKTKRRSLLVKPTLLGKILLVAIPTLILLILLAWLTPITWKRIGPGFVGVRIKLYGEDRGVDSVTMVTGRVWYSPWWEEVHPFPTFLQQATWSEKGPDGDGPNQAITFNSQEGASFTADIYIAYQFVGESVPEIFRELRQDADVITNTYVRGKVRGAFDRIAGSYKAVEIFGDKKGELLTKVRDYLQEELKGRFIFDTVEFIGRPRVDDNVQASINATITATQDAIKAENKVRQVKAEADQEVAKAEGEATKKLKLAEAEAQANRVITESITPTLLQYRAIESWDGKLPAVLGGDGAIPLIQLDNLRSKEDSPRSN